MAEPFKNLVDASAVGALADRLAAVDPAFPRAAFVAQATDGLDGLELKARVGHVAAVLRRQLPAAWPDALDRLVRALPARDVGADDLSAGMGFWPALSMVADHGLGHPEASLTALPALTTWFSAEFAVRPFLIEHPERAWDHVGRWVTHDSVHVRRLASEGTRPRLPWGRQLRASVADPARGLAVLDALVDDPERYVQRSVANHLNDVSKDHPGVAVAVAERWLGTPGEGRGWIVRHGLRTLLKRGDPSALALLGYPPPQGRLEALSVTPDPVAIGARAELVATLGAAADQRWMVDWVVRAPRADGTLGQRVLKGRTREVRSGTTVTVTQALSLKPVTTRVTRPGRWQVAVQVNGEVLGEAAFTVNGAAQ